ncbi:DUF1707 domain-containing protein [Actinoplanes sp. NPDC049599]|uniref:DUF1707 domain-containing protein n=1 Tax=Actinoplanes sp. NPDC049599 TaxID=3363903 RepID=UPI0037AEC77B
MSRDEMRAGDSERQQVADRLKAALDEGRLDLHEYDERLGQTYAAKTYGELDRLLTDLPGPIPAQQSRVEPYQPPAAPAPAAEVGQVAKPGGPPFLGPYGGVVVVCFVIWGVSCLASGEFVYPWPLWLLIPLILGLLSRFTHRNR